VSRLPSPRRRTASAPGLPPRIGIFGGTFNPIHLAHLRSAEEVCEALGLRQVLFIPSAMPPHKGSSGLAPAAHRVAMVRAAIARNPRFRLSTMEIERHGRSYSIDTVRALRARLPAAALYFIVGLDAFRDIATWKDYAALFELTNIVVTSRPPHAAGSWRTALPVAVRQQFCYRRRLRALEHRTGHLVVFQPITALDISASVIRQHLQHRRSIRYLVPPVVERYIVRHRLYERGVH